MTIKEVWEYGNAKNLDTIKYLCELLVIDKQVCQWSDDWSRASYYIQPRFQKAVAGHLRNYIERQRGSYRGRG